MLGIEPLSAEEISFLLDQSKPFQEIQRHPLKKLATLRGKTVALAFFEPSTRTRISFATAAALLGALTIRDRRGTLEGLNVTILGDILHSRVARSNIHLLSKFGCRITLCGPPMWVPREIECLVTAGSAVRRVTRIEEALEKADVVMTLRVQQERLHERALSIDEYILQYQLTPARLRIAKPDALVMHPGP